MSESLTYTVEMTSLPEGSDSPTQISFSDLNEVVVHDWAIQSLTLLDVDPYAAQDVIRNAILHNGISQVKNHLGSTITVRLAKLLPPTQLGVPSDLRIFHLSRISDTAYLRNGSGVVVWVQSHDDVEDLAQEIIEVLVEQESGRTLVDPTLQLLSGGELLAEVALFSGWSTIRDSQSNTLALTSWDVVKDMVTGGGTDAMAVRFDEQVLFAQSLNGVLDPKN